jgi:hypothetical protein
VSTDNGIEILNIDSKKTERRIKTSKPCFGITHHNGVLLWCEYQRGIQMMYFSDDRVITLVEQFTLSLISLIDITDGCCITEIICACSAFVVLITTDGGLVSIDTDPNVVIVENISCPLTLQV